MPQPDHHTPAECHVCGERASGVGMGFTDYRDKNPRWLCLECAALVDDIRKIKRMDAYELRARRGGVEAAGPIIEQFGTDLGAYSEEQADMLAGTIWKGCAAELRRLIRSGEAPW